MVPYEIGVASHVAPPSPDWVGETVLHLKRRPESCEYFYYSWQYLIHLLDDKGVVWSSFEVGHLDYRI
jgi:hypothetical protein